MKKCIEKMITVMSECRVEYDTILRLSTGTARQNHADKILAIIKKNPELKNYITYNPNYHYWKDRFKFDNDNFNKLINSEFGVITVKKETFDDGVDYDNIPKGKGLYFLGDCRWNPLMRCPEFWVKIGKTTDMESRMRQYNTCCPVVWHIDYSKDYRDEKYYHNRLLNICIATCNHNNEWFMVDEITYLEMCEKGFAYFD